VRFVDDLDGSEASGTVDYGHKVNDRGRISKAVIEAYQAAS
jgi:hypothetical protein